MAVAVYLLAKRFIAGLFTGSGTGRRGYPHGGAGEADEMVQDPCCKVYVPKSRAVKASSGGETHYFCSEDCARKYSSGQGCKE